MTAADTIKEIAASVKRCADCGARFGIDAVFCPFDGVPLSTSTWDKAGDPRAHVVVDDRYEVLEPLGEGGMGTVYKVRHVTLDRLFAMKVLRRDLATDADLARRFVQEARATAAIKHPSVVAITDFGDMEDGIPYFVMELLEGETLATRIRGRGPIPPKDAITIAKQIAGGLAASHAANVIHRDLKPDNVFLLGKRSVEEEIRIVDFGAAKIIGASKLTRPGIVFGTPYYMSPEQASGQPVDGRADVYSLGVLLYEMITGRVPFEADTYMGVLTKHLFQAPPRMIVPSGIQLGDLEAVVMRALQKEPAARYTSMSMFGEALESAASGRSVNVDASVERRAQPTLKLGAMTTADRIELSVGRRVAAEAQRKRRLLAVVALSACATLVAGAGLVAYATSSESTSKAKIAPAAAAKPVATAPASTVPPSSPAAGGETAGPEPAAGIATAPAVTSEAVPRPTPPAATSPAVTKRPAPGARASSGAASPSATPRVPAPAPTDDFPDPWKR